MEDSDAQLVLDCRRGDQLAWERLIQRGPSRFYQLFVLGPNNSTKSFWQISTDGNLLERPVQVNSSRISVAERVDVIVDFTNDAGKTFFLEKPSGAGRRTWSNWGRSGCRSGWAGVRWHQHIRLRD